jgi:hypothetical protein
MNCEAKMISSSLIMKEGVFIWKNELVNFKIRKKIHQKHFSLLIY